VKEIDSTQKKVKKARNISGLGPNQDELQRGVRGAPISAAEGGVKERPKITGTLRATRCPTEKHGPRPTGTSRSVGKGTGTGRTGDAPICEPKSMGSTYQTRKVSRPG
jgi:hypothetical protein